MKTFFVVNAFLIFLNCILLFYSTFIANLIKLNDYPDNLRKIHETPVPLIGGIILFLSIIVNLCLFYFEEMINLRMFLGFLLIFLGIFIIGVVDDYKNVGPKNKLILSTIIFLLFLFIFDEYIITRLEFTSFDKIVSIGYLSLPFTILCFLLLQNAINMIDGIDGLTASVSLAILFLCLLYNNFSNSFLNYFILSIIIFLFIYIIFNFKKKSFLGDSGSFILSLAISIVIITIYNEKNLTYFKTYFKTEQIFLLLLLPGLDMFRVFILRLSINKNPFRGDNNHLHHYLLNYLNKYQICVIYFLFILISNCLANFFPTKTLIILLCSIILYLTILVFSRKLQDF